MISNAIFIVLFITSILAIILMWSMMTKNKEHFSSEGEWIMRHVDPSFGGGGLLIPVVRQGDSQQPSQEELQRQRELEKKRQEELEKKRQEDLLKQSRTESPATTIKTKRTPSLVSKGESFTAKQGKIMMGSSEIKLNGINWYGMNKTDMNSVHSLWLTPLDEYMQILKVNNFNAVRIVLSAQLMLNLDTEKVKGANEAKNPGINGMTAGEFLDELVARLEENGILVMLNLHRMAGAGKNEDDIGPLWYSETNPAYSETKVMEAWVTVAKRYIGSPNVFAMDIKNEPHKAEWGGADPKKDWPAFCKKVGDAIHAVNPKVLIGVAGKTKHIWSDNVGPAQTAPVVLTLPDKVFYTPHFYSVYEYIEEFKESAFDGYMDECVGKLVKSGATVIIGEWGWDETVPDDGKWLGQYTTYLKSIGLENQFYWAFSENAGKNHGIFEKGTSKVKADKITQIQKLSPNPTLLEFV